MKIKQGDTFTLRVYGKEYQGEIVNVGQTSQDKIYTVDFMRNGEWETTTNISKTFFKNMKGLITWKKKRELSSRFS